MMARRFLYAALTILATALNPVTPADAASEGPLVPLARPGVWQGVSHLIPYDGRIWFANSASFEDTNAADIYSYDPRTGALRYERGLFTQDTGTPTVFGGKLFWPFEDPRFSMDAGEYVVTDGRAWRWRRLPEGSAMHLHAMSACRGDLFAVTGGWDGQLQISKDGGKSWRLTATYPRGEANFSRLVAIAPFGGRCFVGASAEGRRGGKLLEWANERLVAVPGWPEADHTEGLTVHNGLLFAWIDSGQARKLFAFDGEKTVPAAAPPSGLLQALSSDGTYLWAVSGDNGAGALWRSRDGSAWTEIQRFKEMPISVSAVEGAVFVGTYREDGGALWGPSGAIPPLGVSATPFEIQNPNSAGAADTAGLIAEIERLVSGEVEISGFRDFRFAFQRLSEISDPAFGRYLAALYPKIAIKGHARMFTNERVLQADLAHWYLLGAMAVNGYGRVPLDLLSMPFSGRQNRAQKYFDPSIAAIATVGWIGQNDSETVAALIRRLDQGKDPKWLRADVIAALSALTGKPFGHDAARWRTWWNDR